MIDMKKMLEVTNEERIVKFHVQEYERCARYIMPACSRAAGRHIDQTFAIIDVKGISPRPPGRLPALLGPHMGRPSITRNPSVLDMLSEECWACKQSSVSRIFCKEVTSWSLHIPAEANRAMLKTHEYSDGEALWLEPVTCAPDR